jgi:hypothetical protein
MSTNLTLAKGGRPHRTWFVLVNNRVPRTGDRCALCGGIVEQGYVRDSQTRRIYCDSQCFAGGAYNASPLAMASAQLTPVPLALPVTPANLEETPSVEGSP